MSRKERNKIIAGFLEKLMLSLGVMVVGVVSFLYLNIEVITRVR